MKCCKCDLDLSHWDYIYKDTGSEVPTDGIYCEDCADAEGLSEGWPNEDMDDEDKHLGCKSWPCCDIRGCCRD